MPRWQNRLSLAAQSLASTGRAALQKQPSATMPGLRSRLHDDGSAEQSHCAVGHAGSVGERPSPLVFPACPRVDAPALPAIALPLVAPSLAAPPLPALGGEVAGLG